MIGETNPRPPMGHHIYYFNMTNGEYVGTKSWMFQGAGNCLKAFLRSLRIYFVPSTCFVNRSRDESPSTCLPDEIFAETLLRRSKLGGPLRSR